MKLALKETVSLWAECAVAYDVLSLCCFVPLL